MAVKRRAAAVLFAVALAIVIQLFSSGSALAATKGKKNTKSTTTESSTIDENKTGTVNGGLDGIDVTVSNDNGKIKVRGTDVNGNPSKIWNKLFKKYKTVLVGISGIVFLTMILVFLMFTAKVGSSGDNPQVRSNAIRGAVVCGVAAALSGSITTVVGLCWGLLKN